MVDTKTLQPENAVLFHHPDAVDINRDGIMGRHSAGDGFLGGFVKHSGVDHFYINQQSLNMIKILSNGSKPLMLMPLSVLQSPLVKWGIYPMHQKR